MFNVVRSGDTDSYGVVSYMADTPDDVPNLPTTDEQGSTCAIISNADVYVLNSKKEWKLFGEDE